MSAERSSLTSSQTAALNQLRDLTNGADDEVTIGILESVDWDVQRAAEMIFESGAPPPVRHTSNSNTDLRDFQHLATFETFDVDDSAQHTGLDDMENDPLIREAEYRPPAAPHRATAFTFITYPLHLISSLFRFVFSVLRIPLRLLPLPHLPFLSLNLLNWWYNPRLRSTPPGGSGRGGIERWIRELEEETGAICLGRSPSEGVSSGISGPSNSEASSSRLASRAFGAHGTKDVDVDAELDALLGPSSPSSPSLSLPHVNSSDRQRYLPDFQLGSYEHALRVVEKEARVGCIVLVSEEHDDVAEFKRTTLTSNSLLRILHKNNFYVWGGDVRDKEAWQAAKKLGCTTFPFVAFVALQPSRSFIASNNDASSSGASGRDRNPTNPSLTVLSRHSGLDACTPQSLVNHLENTLLPRVTSYLSRVRQTQAQVQTAKETERRARENERRLREEQDRAFEESERRDRERLETRMREEQEERQRVQREAEAENLRLQREVREKEERERVRGLFRHYYGFTTTGGAGGVGGDGEGPIRIAARMPDGRRLVRKFNSGEDDTVGKLFAWVDVNLHSDEATGVSVSDGDPETFVESLIAIKAIDEGGDKEKAAKEWWGFTLSTSYPRNPIPWACGIKLSDVEGLGRGGGQIVVELFSRGNGGKSGRKSLDGRRSLDTNGGYKGKEKEEDDGYVTESSDEE
ncbi:hypothetical protein D9758_007874 [Tetrapyrgos nigripes]|uniref:UBX domain-containing protein n=1 Tax=Tetrapyrgos nigripes TaxID=182062 RepID=A0A8H5D3P7_9AGAR|nr:hypothetical protein D9758_007874 [Tetrapyrgos nigripes]